MLRRKSLEKGRTFGGNLFVVWHGPRPHASYTCVDRYLATVVHSHPLAGLRMRPVRMGIQQEPKATPGLHLMARLTAPVVYVLKFQLLPLDFSIMMRQKLGMPFGSI